MGAPIGLEGSRAGNVEAPGAVGREGDSEGGTGEGTGGGLREEGGLRAGERGARSRAEGEGDGKGTEGEGGGISTAWVIPKRTCGDYHVGTRGTLRRMTG